MRLAFLAAAIAFVVLVVVLAQGALDDVGRWAVEMQRDFQREIAGSVRALRTGEPGALLALMGAAAAYGFVHAVGPGHGKYLIGGVGLGSSVSARRLLGLAFVSSLAQALWAILLVYGGFFLLEASARHMTVVAEQYLAPASYLAVAGIGMLLAVRGGRALYAHLAPEPAHAHAHAHGHAHGHDHGGHGHGHHDHHHDHGACCHAHGPSPQDVANLTSLRDAAVLVASIAIRPCTGAIFLLVIAWQMDIQAAGAAAVIAMGLGTGMLTSFVAVSSIAARGLAFAYSGTTGLAPIAAPTLQLAAGLLIMWFSAALLSYTLG